MCLSTDTSSSGATVDNTATVLPDATILRHVVDAHCHPTDAKVLTPEAVADLRITICAMSTRQDDQPLVRDLATKNPDCVIPCFGYHPWWTHWISTRPTTSKDAHYRSLFLPNPTSELKKAYDDLFPHLPPPIYLTDLLIDLRANLTAFPNSFLGEVGLDRVFRVSHDYSATPRQLTPFNIPMNHQTTILEAQIAIAVELGRNISLHSVKIQMPTMDLLARMAEKYGQKWYDISVDMHSSGLSPEMWTDMERKHTNIFLSESMVINSRSPNHRALIAACSPNRILVESDYADITSTTEETWKMILVIAEVRGWTVETEWNYDSEKEGEKDKWGHESHWGVVRRLEENWKAFKSGGHKPPAAKRSRKERTQNDFASDGSDSD